VFGGGRTPTMPRASVHSGGRIRTTERRRAGAELGVVGRGECLSTRPIEQPLHAAKTVSTPPLKIPRYHSTVFVPATLYIFYSRDGIDKEM